MQIEEMISALCGKNLLQHLFTTSFKTYSLPLVSLYLVFCSAQLIKKQLDFLAGMISHQLLGNSSYLHKVASQCNCDSKVCLQHLFFCPFLPFYRDAA